MVVCSCNVITDDEIHVTVGQLTQSNAAACLSPVAVYRSIGRAPRCGCCLPHAARIVKKVAACHRGICTEPDCRRCASSKI